MKQFTYVKIPVDKLTKKCSNPKVINMQGHTLTSERNQAGKLKYHQND